MLTNILRNDGAEPSLKRVKYLGLSYEALVCLLQLDGRRLIRMEGMPADAKIVRVSSDLCFMTGQLTLMIASDEFDEVPEGGVAPDLDIECSSEAPQPSGLYSAFS